MENFSDKIVEKIKTRILCSIVFFLILPFMRKSNVEKCCEAGQATNDNMAHAH
jgi:hypothetical protein